MKPLRIALATLACCVVSPPGGVRAQEHQAEIQSFLAALDPPSLAEIAAELAPAPSLEEALTAEELEPLAPQDARRDAEDEGRLRQHAARGELEAAAELLDERARRMAELFGDESWRARRAREERRDVELLMELDAADREALLALRSSTPAPTTPPATLLERTWENLAARLSILDHPIERSQVLYNLVGALLNVGRFDDARVVACEAWKEARTVYAPPHPDLTRVAVLLGRISLESGRLREAEAFVLGSLEGSRQLHGPTDPRTAYASTFALGYLTYASRHAEAVRCANEILDGPTALSPADRVNVLHSLATARHNLGQVQAAADAYREALAMLEQGGATRSLPYAIVSRDSTNALIDAGRARAGRAACARRVGVLPRHVAATRPPARPVAGGERARGEAARPRRRGRGPAPGGARHPCAPCSRPTTRRCSSCAA